MQSTKSSIESAVLGGLVTTQSESRYPPPHPTERLSRWASEEIAAGNHQRDEAMALVSHELRNHLGAIRNATQVLRGGSSASAATSARVLIERQVEQMTRLVDDLLDVSQIRNGRLRLRPDRVDLCAIVRNSAQTVMFIMQQHSHRMTTSLPDTPLWLHGDADRLEQVFMNLLINAAKYTDAGGDVEISVKQEANEAIARVRDTGIGIAADVLPQVFDLYVQADPSSRGGGLGLGLPLVRSLVESHGGRVTAASAGPGQGSELTIRLPILQNTSQLAVADSS
jgi:signal transduction histidine kinase